MADQKKANLEKLAAQTSVIPTLKMPDIPDFLKKNPKYRTAWIQYEKELDYWRKTLGSGRGGGSAAVVSGSQTTTIVTAPPSPPPAPPPFVEQDLKSLYLFEWVMS